MHSTSRVQTYTARSLAKSELWATSCFCWRLLHVCCCCWHVLLSAAGPPGSSDSTTSNTQEEELLGNGTATSYTLQGTQAQHQQEQQPQQQREPLPAANSGKGPRSSTAVAFRVMSDSKDLDRGSTAAASTAAVGAVRDGSVQSAGYASSGGGPRAEAGWFGWLRPSRKASTARSLSSRFPCLQQSRSDTLQRCMVCPIETRVTRSLCFVGMLLLVNGQGLHSTCPSPSLTWQTGLWSTTAAAAAAAAVASTRCCAQL